MPGSLPAVADRIAAAIRNFFPSRPVRLLGNGYGGFVALQAVTRHPGLADRLVLADAGAAFSEPGRQAFRAMAAAVAAKGLQAIADTAVIVAACEALATLDLRPQLADVRTPVLAVVGELDEATPPAMAYEVVAGLPNAELTILDGLAHVPQLQAPQRFLDAVLPFLS